MSRHAPTQQTGAIAALIRQAETAAPITVRYAGGGSEDHRQISAAPPPFAHVSLGGELIPAAKAIEETGIAYSGLDPEKPGEVLPISAHVMRESRFCRAGGVLVLNSPAPRSAKDSQGETVFYDSPKQFHIIEPLPFQRLRPDPEAALSAWPVSGIDDQLVESDPSSATMYTHSARVRLTRRQQKHLPRELWSYEAAKAIARGLALVVDREVFRSLDDSMAATAWSWSWAATKDIQHGELSAIIGTNGTGAQVRQDGALTYGGVCPAELCPATTSTLVGAWNRSAVFVRDDVQLIARHIGISGDLELTVFASVRFAAPDLGYFIKPSA